MNGELICPEYLIGCFLKELGLVLLAWLSEAI
jgi:hypothetical protein